MAELMVGRMAESMVGQSVAKMVFLLVVMKAAQMAGHLDALLVDVKVASWAVRSVEMTAVWKVDS